MSNHTFEKGGGCGREGYINLTYRGDGGVVRFFKIF